MLWQSAENSLSAGSIYGAGKKARRLERALFIEYSTGWEGGWADFGRADRRDCFFFPLRGKAATQPGPFSLWTHRLHLPFCPAHSVRHRAPLPAHRPPFVSRHSRKRWKTRLWSQLTSALFPFSPESIGTANTTTSSSTCAKKIKKKRESSPLKMQEQVWGRDSQLHTGAEFRYQSRPSLWTRIFFFQEVFFSK